MEAQLRSQVHSERVALEKVIPLVTPFVVYLEPSGYCNLKCKFCPHGVAGSPLKKDIMSLELFKKVIDDLTAFPEKIKLMRVCGNGDPLTNKALVSMVEYAHERQVLERIELISNGVLLTPHLIENLPHFVDRIVISIEGLSADDYLRICGVRVDFEKLVWNIGALHGSKGECVLHVKIHHAAVPTAEKREEFLTTFGRICDEIFVENLVPMWPQCDSPYSSSVFRYNNGDVVKRKVCAQIFKGVQVQADGEVLPCCVDWKRVNLLGNVKDEPLRDIWNGSRMRKLQIDHLSGKKARLKLCRDCAMNDYCEVDNLDGHAQECIERLKRDELIH
ncbi:MAG TPA: radical SAM/SPASM domain-containing protein [Syntrophobacteraceae bacterium]|nr:radical SAM/SPASM domain-containing protein [Syntrophobacteraceae bacterium]